MGSAGYDIPTRPCQMDKLEKEDTMKQTKKPFDRVRFVVGKLWNRRSKNYCGVVSTRQW